MRGWLLAACLAFCPLSLPVSLMQPRAPSFSASLVFAALSLSLSLRARARVCCVYVCVCGVHGRGSGLCLGWHEIQFCTCTCALRTGTLVSWYHGLAWIRYAVIRLFPATLVLSGIDHAWSGELSTVQCPVTQSGVWAHCTLQLQLSPPPVFVA